MKWDKIAIPEEKSPFIPNLNFIPERV